MARLFLAKFAKIILVGLAVFGARAAKIFKRKKDQPTPPELPPHPPPTA